MSPLLLTVSVGTCVVQGLYGSLQLCGASSEDRTQVTKRVASISLGHLTSLPLSSFKILYVHLFIYFLRQGLTMQPWLA